MARSKLDHLSTRVKNHFRNNNMGFAVYGDLFHSVDEGRRYRLRVQWLGEHSAKEEVAEKIIVLADALDALGIPQHAICNLRSTKFPTFTREKKFTWGFSGEIYAAEMLHLLGVLESSQAA